MKPAKRADTLQGRLQKRMEELQARSPSSRRCRPLSWAVCSSFRPACSPGSRRPRRQRHQRPIDTQAQRRASPAIIMEVERGLGFEPIDREFEKLGYDIESRVPGTGKLRFIEVKGRVSGADTITVTRNEILYSLKQARGFHPGDRRVHEETSTASTTSASRSGVSRISG